MLWAIGAAAVALMSVACGVNLGSRVSKGAENVWEPAIFGWGVLFHGGAGLLALWMLTNFVR